MTRTRPDQDSKREAAVSRSTLALAILSAFALPVCTVHTYSGEPAPKPARAAHKKPEKPPVAKSPSKPAPAVTPPPKFEPKPVPSAGPAPKPTVELPRPILPPNFRPSGDLTSAPKVTEPILFGNGTAGAFRGLAYVVPPDTKKMPDFSLMVPFATVYTDSFNVESQEFKGGFPGALLQEEWFAIRYDGRFTLAKAGTYSFKLVSDDGALLHINGEKIIDNDGEHSAKSATGKKELSAGTHRLRLEYFQAAKGNVALMLFITENGKERILTGTQ